MTNSKPEMAIAYDFDGTIVLGLLKQPLVTAEKKA